MKRPITMLAIGAILIGGTVPAAALSTPENNSGIATADVAAGGGTTAAAAPVDRDDIQTFASPSSITAAPIVRDSFEIQQVKQQVVITAAGISGSLEFFPANGPVNDGFGYRGSEFHGGIDIMAPEGSTIVAASPGTVESVTYGGGWGRHVIIDHGNGVKTLYAHMIEGSPLVTAGQWVAAGTPLGLVGNTGYSTFPHLHFEVYVFDARVDPAPWLP
ncbi:MAG: M23 family metallopeptidase [Rhodoglobus sp.]